MGGSTERRVHRDSGETATKRLRAKLSEVKREAALRRHEPIPKQGKWLRSVVHGYFNYHGVPGNTAALEAFRTRDRTKLASRTAKTQPAAPADVGTVPSGTSIAGYPRPKVLHPYPDVRFYAKHPK